MWVTGLRYFQKGKEMTGQEFANPMKHLEEENKRLRVSVAELSILNEIATVISSTLSLDRIIALIVHECVKHLKVEQGAVQLLEEKDQQRQFHTMVRKADTVSSVLPFRLGTQLTGWMLKNEKPLRINDFQKDERFQMMGREKFPVRSLLSVPLRLKGRMIGLLTVFNKKSEQGFTSDDQRLLSIIAAQSAQVIENARLYKEEQLLFRMQEEMRMAQKIQMNLLPKSAPEITGYDVAGRSLPAKNVGGDYYDFIPVETHRIVFCIGDVSGKGMPAALLMANLQAAIRGQSLLNITLEDCLQFPNKLLCQSSGSNKFATFFYCLLDTEKHEFCYSNAGHNPPLLFLKGERSPQELKVGGLVLGFLEDATYQKEVRPFCAGDLLLLYSDGITEAFNADDEEFGEERLREIILKNREEPAQVLLDKIIAAAEQHAGDVPRMDDMTALVIKRNA